MSGLIKLQEELHNKLLILRSLEATVAKPLFQRLWDDSKPEQQEFVRKALVAGDKILVESWIRTHPSIDVGERSVRDLYSIAQRLRIKNYSRLSKEELIVSIQQAEALSGPQ